MRLAATVKLAVLALALAGAVPRSSGQHAGLLFDQSELTLSLGDRTEIAGPLFYDEQSGERHTWALPSLYSSSEDPGLEMKEIDSFYPLLTYNRYGKQYRWQFLQVLSFSGGPSQTEEVRDRTTLFPLYFHQHSSDPSENYTALAPFYGHMKHHLFRDEIYIVMFPLYSETRKKDVVTDNYLYPFFHLRRGDQLEGWQLWPLAGHEHQEPVTRTNGFGDTRLVGGHDSLFVLWPFYLSDQIELGTTNAGWQFFSFPACSLLRTPQRDSTTFLWPLFSKIDDREKKYREWDLPWPVIVFARGKGKTTDRVLPFFGRSHNDSLESDFYAWPIYKHTHGKFETLDRERHRIVFFLYDDVVDKNLETGHFRRRADFWPLWDYHRDFNGSTRHQVLAPLEVFLPNNPKIARDWSPLWSLWRAERNPETGAASQSLLWNLYRHQTAAKSSQTSLLFGLFQSKTAGGHTQVRLFYLPFGTSGSAEGPERTGQAKLPAGSGDKR